MTLVGAWSFPTYLASGYGFAQALEEATRPKPVPETVDPEDFAKAVTRPESRRLFRVAENEEELQEMLSKYHPEEEKPLPLSRSRNSSRNSMHSSNGGGMGEDATNGGGGNGGRASTAEQSRPVS